MTKKLNLPKKINVVGVEYKVIVLSEFPDNYNNYWGYHDAKNSEIWVLTKSGNSKINECNLLQTMLHEIFHAIDYQNCEGKTTENIIEKSSDLMFWFFSQNKIYIGEKRLPKILYFYGLPYTIIKDYEFDSNGAGGLNLAIDNAELKIYCGKTDNTEMLKKNLLAILFDKFIIGEFFTDEERCLVQCNSFSAALYQVLKETKLDELIYEWCKK